MKRTINHFAKKYRKNTEGNVAIMMAVTLFGLVGGLALAVDLSNAYFAKQRLQQTTDAVALMAAKDKSLDTDAKLQEAAQALYDATYPNSTGTRIIIESIKRDGDSVIVSTRNNIDTHFTGIFKKSNQDVAVKSVATFTQRSIDVALVLDTTGSMGGKVSGDPSGTVKLASLQAATHGLLDSLEGSGADEVRVSVVPFAQYVNVGTEHKRESWLDLDRRHETSWKGCVGSRLMGQDESPNRRGDKIPAFVSANCASEIQPLTKDLNAVRTSVDGFRARGWTYIPSGIVWGWRTLEGELPKKAAPKPKGTVHKDVMIIMTDGVNTRSKRGLDHEGWSQNDANRKTTSLCNSVKRDSIEIYTITYSLSDTTTKRMMQNCASDNTKFFDARTSADLNRAFQTIASELDVLRISS